MRPIKGKKEEGTYEITQLSLILEQHIKTDRNYRKNIKTDRASSPIWALPARSCVFVRLVSLAQIGELARRLVSKASE